MTIKIILKNQQKSEQFASIFQHVKLFTEHINIMFEKERIYIQSMDSARVSIFEVFLAASWFDTYENTTNGGVTIGINSTMFFKILNTRDKLQETQITFDNTNQDKLFVQFVSENKMVFDKHFEMPLLDLEYETMTIPDFESKAELSISSINFANIINQLKLFGDTIDIDCDEENISLTSVSQESGKMLVKINIDDLTAFSINEGEKMKLSFSLTNLHNICMYSKISKDINIYLTENYPIKLVYSLEEKEDSEVKLVFYLAPKINDNDE
jgi:proliferating cell nuclear antigen PCNA